MHRVVQYSSIRSTVLCAPPVPFTGEVRIARKWPGRLVRVRKFRLGEETSKSSITKSPGPIEYDEFIIM